MLDALRARKERFVFEDAEIALRPSAMMFITMNPGYPGRAELPESVKVRDLHALAWGRQWQRQRQRQAAAAALNA